MKQNLVNNFMETALLLAAKSQNEIPVGAVIVYNNEIIAGAYNQKEALNDVSAHAEMLVIKQASQKLERWRLDNTSLFVTLEPCPMCASAILYSRIPQVFFGAYDPLYGALGSALDMTQYIKFKPEIVGGIHEEQARVLLKDFFNTKR